MLNSCESAQANNGDEANLAKVFAEEGVRNILAMSFKLQADTATRFTYSFYKSLFELNRPFSLAVADAREALRINDTRCARFGLQIRLQDWIVPVVYTAGERHSDSIIQCSAVW